LKNTTSTRIGILKLFNLMKNLILLLFLSIQGIAQKPIALPRSSPEAQGVSSEGIIHFIDAIQNSKHELHSFMVLRHGKVIAEGWNSPYRSDLKHTMYSASKSFTATAIGFAVIEKKTYRGRQGHLFFSG
jgi:hypothetical protein